MNRKAKLSQLPAIAFATLAVTGMTIAISLGESRYYRVNTTKTAAELNRMYGVTPAEARAMLAGVLLGWRTHLANPALYDEDGKLLETPAEPAAPGSGR